MKKVRNYCTLQKKTRAPALIKRGLTEPSDPIHRRQAPYYGTGGPAAPALLPIFHLCLLSCAHLP